MRPRTKKNQSGVPLQAGLEEVGLLRWSPCGTYLLGGGPPSAAGGGCFRVWETSTWTSVPWRSLGGGCI